MKTRLQTLLAEYAEQFSQLSEQTDIDAKYLETKLDGIKRVLMDAANNQLPQAEE